MKVYNKELTKIINEINDIKARLMSKNKLTYKFNKFIKNLNIDTNQKLDVITEVIYLLFPLSQVKKLKSPATTSSTNNLNSINNRKSVMSIDVTFF